MNFRDIFRSFIGIDTNMRPPYQEGDQNTDLDSPQFFHGMTDMMDEMDQVFQNFDNIFKNMGFGEMPHRHYHGFSFQLPGLEDDQQQSTPREHMLKEPDISERNPHPPTRRWDFSPRLPAKRYEKKDTDLDDEALRGDLGSLFGKSNTRSTEITPQPRTYFKSVTIRTVRTPDGKIKQEKTVRDGSGNEETTVTRSLGDQTHTVTTTKDPTGDEQVIEDFKNINEKDVPQFDRKWNFTNIFTKESNRDSDEQNLNPLTENLDHNKNSIFRNIFGSLFSEKKS